MNRFQDGGTISKTPEYESAFRTLQNAKVSKFLRNIILEKNKNAMLFCF